MNNSYYNNFIYKVFKIKKQIKFFDYKKNFYDKINLNDIILITDIEYENFSCMTFKKVYFIHNSKIKIMKDSTNEIFNCLEIL